MPRRNKIKNTLGVEMYNIQINPENFDFNPNTSFVKWAAMAVSSFDNVPKEMETLEIQKGLYAVFLYKGNQSDAADFFEKIYKHWLPDSIYDLDNRPQFEILGEKYKMNDSNSEEEIWIPIKKK
jgi:AraC family transcriptional regulator